MSDQPEFNPATTTPQLLTAIAGLSSTNVVQLRNDIRKTIETVSAAEYREIQKATIGLFFNDQKKWRLVFFSFASDQDRKESLSLQLLDRVGRDYKGGPNDLISLSRNANLPLLASSSVDRLANKSRRLDYKFLPINSDLLRHGDPIGHVTSVGSAGTLSIPPSSSFVRGGSDVDRSGREREFFECLVLSAVKIPWPFSSSEIVALTIFGGLSGKLAGTPGGGDLDRQGLLDRLRIDSLLGLVVGQLFARIALAKTHLQNLDPLVEELLVDGWREMLANDDGTAAKSAIYQQLPEFLEGIASASTPYAALSVLRLLVGKSDRSAVDWSDLAKSLPGLICRLPSVPLVRPLVSMWKPDEVECSSTLKQVYDELAGALVSDDGKTPPECKKALYRNLACALAGVSGDPEEEVISRWQAAAKDNAEIRTELAALCVKRLLQSSASLDLHSPWWTRLKDCLAMADSSDALTSFAVTVLAGVAPAAIPELMTALRDLPQVSRDTRDFLSQQLEEQGEAELSGDQTQRPKIVGVLSQKGGVGKSTMAMLAALAFSKAGKKVCVVELDFSGTMLASFGNQPQSAFTNKSLGSLRDRADYEALVQGSVKAHFENAQGGPPTPFVWPADPSFQATLLSGANERGSGSRRRLEFTLLETLVESMKAEVDVVIFDAPAEFKDISRSLAALLRYRGGVALFVGSLAPPALMPLVEAYWRVLRNSRTHVTLVLNRVRSVDLPVAKSVETLVDYLSSKPTAAYVPFGMGSVSPLALQMLIETNGLGLVAISDSEELERAFRASDRTAMGTLCDSFTSLSDWVDTTIRRWR